MQPSLSFMTGSAYVEPTTSITAERMYSTSPDGLIELSIDGLRGGHFYMTLSGPDAIRLARLLTNAATGR